ncbi:MAG: invasion associated locus B family protein [Methyloceanibacter sp.]|uniref:invasion associated locus B family protein n=1 Tax=Methyloceanibacter sp. TaxID=1965321 RepID=UPI003D6D0089
MRSARVFRTCVLALCLAAFTQGALAQEGGNSSAAKKKAPAPAAQGTTAAAPQAAKPPAAKVAGSFGGWTLLCGKEGEDTEERCSLVMPLVEKETQKLVFRVIVTYGPQGNLVLRVDGPTGVALQRGVEFSPDTKKIYRMAFQTCLPMGCKALLLISDDLKKELAAATQGAITVYALNGTPVQTVAALDGFAQALAALDKHRAGQ